MSNWSKIVAPAKIIATYLTRCNSDSYSLTRVTHFNLFTLELRPLAALRPPPANSNQANTDIM